MAERRAKKVKLDNENDEELHGASTRPGHIRSLRASFLSSLQRGVSPPPRKATESVNSAIEMKIDVSGEQDFPPAEESGELNLSQQVTAAAMKDPMSQTKPPHKVIKSPFQLTRIRDLPAEDNQDTVSIGDLICDPMIREIWFFDYLFDPDWIVQNLDPDTRSLTKVILVHGSWRNEDGNRIRIIDSCSRYPLMSHVTAYIPDAFGTHHTKMMILFRHDDMCEVIIHTANMIGQDWRNMTQGLWRTGQLPLLPGSSNPASVMSSTLIPASGEVSRIGNIDGLHALGSGVRFKHDLLLYLEAYTDKSGRRKLSDLVKQVVMYDFSSVKGALVASVPRKIPLNASRSDKPLWGWPSMQRVLQNIPIRPPDPDEPARIVAQVSSIATLGPTDKWLMEILTPSPNSSPTAAKAAKDPVSPLLSILYPTPRAIRNSLDGYRSGASIHLKLDSAPAQRQITWLRPYLCDWSTSDLDPDKKHLNAGRSLAAPHIKTYIRFRSSPLPNDYLAPHRSSQMSSNDTHQEIDWALLTSANLSTQAWGSTGKNEVVVKSYELGVLVWPELYGPNARMVPAFKSDTPSLGKQDAGVIVGLRMPYDLPLSPYKAGEDPWCPTLRAGYTEPDRFGGVWRGYSDR